jgi:secreted PhoX family phosphatase
MPRRRAFLQGLGAAAALLPLESVLVRLASPQEPHSPLADFIPIAATDEDDLVLPDGFTYDLVIRWGQPFTRRGQRFGYNNDWIGCFPLGSDEDVLLAVNHEYPSLATKSGNADLYRDSVRALHRREATVLDMKADLGMSMVRVRRDPATGAWRAVLRDPLNRRIDAFTPMAVDGPAAALMGTRTLRGTFENCAGQVTPWQTALSCEENIQNRVPEEVDVRGRFQRGGLFDLPGGHYGWVVEVDPFDPGSRPVKHTALGRFRHENAGLRAEPGRPVAAYMGDDRIGGHVWKFVSAGAYHPGDAASNRRLLSEGTLHVARFRPDGSGEWRPLVLESPLDPSPDPNDLQPEIPPGAATLGDVYSSLGAVLMDAYRAANLVGGSPSGRPEDVEVHPKDGSVFVAFTASAHRPGLWTNRHGEVWRLEEETGDVTGRRFRWERFAVGGPPDPALAAQGRVFTQPDNLVIDRRGDLWMTCDIAPENVNQVDPFAVFKNSGVFRLPVSGPDRGRPAQFASVPCEAEPTGPCFAPGEQALFLSVQHPGERFGIRRTAEAGARGSNWPSRRLGAVPQPAVVAIRRR